MIFRRKAVAITYSVLLPLTASHSPATSNFMKTTPYFDRRRKDRPYLRDEWLEIAREKPFYTEKQADGRMRHYIYIPEHDKYLRVVFEGEMVHNAFLDSAFTRKKH